MQTAPTSFLETTLESAPGGVPNRRTMWTCLEVDCITDDKEPSCFDIVKTKCQGCIRHCFTCLGPYTPTNRCIGWNIFQGVVVLATLIGGCYLVTVGQPIVNECQSLKLQEQLDCWNDNKNAALNVTIGAMMIVLSLEWSIRMVFVAWLRSKQTQRAQCVNGRCNQPLCRRMWTWIAFIVQAITLSMLTYWCTFYFKCDNKDDVCKDFAKENMPHIGLGELIGLILGFSICFTMMILLPWTESR